MLAKFGLMHLIATNCCIWLRTLVKAVALLAHEKSGTFFFLWFCHFFMYLLSCSSCSCCPDYNIFERLLVLSRDRHAAAQESMREITETDEFEKLVGAGGNQIILRKYFDILAVFFGCKSIPISLSQLVFCSIKNKIIELKNHTESYSLERSQNFPFPAHCLRRSKTGRETSKMFTFYV